MRAFADEMLDSTFLVECVSADPMLMLVLMLLRACSRDRGVEVWLGLLTQRYSIRCMRPVGWLQTALPGLLYVLRILIVSCEDHSLTGTNQFAAAFRTFLATPTRDH